MRETYYLFRSNRPDKKYVMLMPKYKHLHHFGQIKPDGTPFRDYTLMNDKSSKFYESDSKIKDKIKANYLNRHKNDPKGVHNPSSMSDIILWNKKTLRGGIRDYENKFNVKVVFKDTKLTDTIKKKLLI
tara:strand:- start:406 stop:792 length:387 start_codon:yes stop_codon:yes gene_type:complete